MKEQLAPRVPSWPFCLQLSLSLVQKSLKEASSVVISFSSVKRVLPLLESLVPLEHRRQQASHHRRNHVAAELGDLIFQTMDLCALEGADPSGADKVDIDFLDAGGRGVSVADGIAQAVDKAGALHDSETGVTRSPCT